MPVLVDGEGVIYESAIINEYLEEKYPEARLMPADHLAPRQSADLDRLHEQPATSRRHPTSRTDKEPEKARERMKKHLETLDQEMAGKNYLSANIPWRTSPLFPFYTRRQRYGVEHRRNLPNLKRWGEELIARPQVAPTL